MATIFDCHAGPRKASVKARNLRKSNIRRAQWFQGGRDIGGGRDARQNVQTPSRFGGLRAAREQMHAGSRDPGRHTAESHDDHGVIEKNLTCVKLSHGKGTARTRGFP